jgi:hypothetical protein
MKRENHKNSFKKGLNSIQDHAGSMEEDWVRLEQRLAKYESRRRMVLWTKIFSAVAAIMLLLLTWILLQPVEIIIPPDQLINKQPQQKVDKHNEKGIKENLPSENEPLMPETKVLKRQHAYRDQEAEILSLTDTATEEMTLPFHKMSTVDLVKEVNLIMEIKKPALDIHPDHRQLSQTQVPETNKKVNFALSVMYAPALNSVNNFSGARLGSDAGVLLTLELSKKWSLSTGAIYAKKIYESDFNSYNPSNKASMPYTPDNIYADCRVLDIPLNVNYLLLNNRKNTLKLGTGLSSYLMLKENYELQYQEAGVKNYTYSIKNQNKHLLSILNVQANYERRISSKLGIGLQPYLKIPLSDIGYGNVKLQSLGIAVNLNLNLNAKNPLPVQNLSPGNQN